MSDSLWPHGLYSPWNSPGQNTGVGSLSLLQGIFPTQGLNPGLTCCRRILYQLRHQGSPRYSMLTTKNLFSIPPCKIDPLFHLCVPTPIHSSLVTTTLFFECMFLFDLFIYFVFLFVFYIPYMHEIIEYFSYSIRLISLSIISSRSIHVITNGKMFHLFMAE